LSVSTEKLKVAAIRESGETLSVQGVHALFRSPFVSGRVHTFFDLASKDGQRFIGSARHQLPSVERGNELDR